MAGDDDFAWVLNLHCLQTFAATRAFFLAMTQYPEIQKKAQLELDTIIGPDRLPEFADLDSLPYVRAVMKELLRWHVVTPIGLPHRTVADDEYNGYLIPGGATVVVNIWCVPAFPRTPANSFCLQGHLARS